MSDRFEIPRRVAEAVSRHLDGYHVPLTAPDLPPRLAGPDGAELVFTEDRGRVRVVGVLPVDYHPVCRTRLSIGVSADREPAAIAGDIARRLLPGYVSELAASREWLAEQDRRRDAHATRVQAIRDAVPVAWMRGDPTRDEHCLIQVDGEVDIHIDVPPTGGATVTIRDVPYERVAGIVSAAQPETDITV